MKPESETLGSITGFIHNETDKAILFSSTGFSRDASWVRKRLLASIVRLEEDPSIATITAGAGFVESLLSKTLEQRR